MIAPPDKQLDSDSFLSVHPYSGQCAGCVNLDMDDEHAEEFVSCKVYGDFSTAKQAQVYWLNKKKCPSRKNKT